MDIFENASLPPKNRSSSVFVLSQHHSPVTPVTTLCAEAREAAQKLLNHYVKVGVHLQHSLTYSMRNY